MIFNKNFKDIKTCFCFLDETGLLYSPRDKFFALGILQSSAPQIIYNQIRRVRAQYNYHEELKWFNLDRRIRFEVAMKFFNIFFASDAKFNCIILNKDELDFKKYYQGNLCKVYRNFTIALLKMVIGKDPKEVLILLADDYFAPVSENLESSLKGIVNDHYQKFVVAGVCQIDSKSSDLLQLTDLLLGAIVYDLKRQKRIVLQQNTYKRKFLNFLYQKLGIRKSFFRTRFGFGTRNYVLSGDKIRATIFDPKRSTTSKKVSF